MTRQAMAVHLRWRMRGAYFAARETFGSLLDGSELDTARAVNLEDLNLPTAERVRYEPSGWLDLRRSLDRGSVKPSDVFIDIGSGKGRVLLQAARYPFRRVIGLEMSDELNRIARANLDTRRSKLRCENVELITADILDCEIPDDVTVVYAYNPFGGELFHCLVEKLIASVDRAPRRVRFIYSCAMEHDTLMATGRFRLCRSVPGLRPTPAWSRKLAIRVYELV